MDSGCSGDFKLSLWNQRNCSKWFESYLSNRKQFVSVNGHSSSTCDITCGVTQGSVLSLLFLIIYINDLPNSTKLLNFFLFADDTVLRR